MAKVLLVEDDNNLREIYQARLMAEGYDIVAAQNGEEALVVAKQNKPDLIISDVMMPRISGFEMLDILRNTDELKHTKVIMLTALGQAEDQKRADNLGADRYLVKSQVTLEDIVNAAKELLGEDGAIADVPPPPTPKAEPAVAAAAVPVAAAPVASPVPPPSTTPAAPTVTPTPVVQPVAMAVEPTAAPTPQPAALPPAPVTPAAAPVPTAVVPVTPEPPAVQPTTPVISMPTSEPTAQPVTTAPGVVAPAVTPAPQPVSSSTASDTAAQSLEAEEAALQAQIKTYADEPATTQAAVEPTGTTPTQTVTAVAPTPDTTGNDAAIANAVQQLNASGAATTLQPPSVTNAPEPATAATTVTPELASPAPATPTISSVATPAAAPVTPAATPAAPASAANNEDSLAVAGRKVIQPINPDVSKPNLDELLAKEAATEPAPAATPIIDGAASNTPAAPPMPPHTPGQSFDPNKAL